MQLKEWLHKHIYINRATLHIPDRLVKTSYLSGLSNDRKMKTSRKTIERLADSALIALVRLVK